MLSTTTSSSSSLSAAAQKSQQQWEKKKRTLAAASSTSTSRRPSDLAWRSPLRLRLYGGASAVAVSARHLNDNRHGNDDYDGEIATDDEENNHKNGHHNQNHSASRKMYLSPQMIKAIKSETEALPLPASLASVAMTLLNSTLLWDAYDATDDDDDNHNCNYDSSVKHNNTNNREDDDEPTSSNNFTARFQAAMTTSNHRHNKNNNDGDDLSKYFSGITINDEQQQRQATKLQFDNLCKGLITKGNHVMLSSWGEVRDGLGEEFLFSTLDDDDDGVEEEGGVALDAVGATATNEEAEVAAVTPATTTTTTTPMSKQRLRRHHHRGNLKSIPKKSHPTSPKPTQRRHTIKLKQALKRVAHGAKKKATMGLDAYKQIMLDRMGKSKYNQMFQQATISPAKDLTLLLDENAKLLDDRIEQLEATRRKTRQDELLEKAEQERQARESASKLLRPLTPDETQIVKNAIYGIGPKEEVLASQDADSVQRESMHRLQPGHWLNDEIINYFLKNCLAKRDEKLCAKQSGRKRSHFFNSFFVQTMFDEKNSNYDLRGRYNYKNVRRWSKKVPGKDVFNLKYIFCPINLDNMHWTSACVFMEQKKIQYYDSMGGTDWGKLKGLLQYLKDEWKAKKGGEMDVSEWELVGCQESTPRQLNGFDCGVFTCMFADFVTKDCEPVFQQEHITQCRQRIALSIMKNCAIE
mmetsp:Transcript_27753/g.42835  ORF Transcript_27753/g.42835 Transcript_27753/m.42835 type:complete len:694 (-) Transcript_27753:16-2097(-)